MSWRRSTNGVHENFFLRPNMSASRALEEWHTVPPTANLRRWSCAPSRRCAQRSATRSSTPASAARAARRSAGCASARSWRDRQASSSSCALPSPRGAPAPCTRASGTCFSNAPAYRYKHPAGTARAQMCLCLGDEDGQPAWSGFGTSGPEACIVQAMTARYNAPRDDADLRWLATHFPTRERSRHPTVTMPIRSKPSRSSGSIARRALRSTRARSPRSSLFSQSSRAADRRAAPPTRAGRSGRRGCVRRRCRDARGRSRSRSPARP